MPLRLTHNTVGLVIIAHCSEIRLMPSRVLLESLLKFVEHLLWCKSSAFTEWMGQI